MGCGGKHFKRINHCGFFRQFIYAGMAELADAPDLGSGVHDVQVQVLLPAPNQNNPNQVFLIGDGFGLFVFFERFEDTHFRNGVVKRPTSKQEIQERRRQIEIGVCSHEKDRQLCV